MKNVHALYMPLVVFLLSGCATTPASTGFVKNKEGKSGYGYNIQEVEPEIYASVYEGNQATSPASAYAYTELAAYTDCLGKGKVAYVEPPNDITHKETHTNVGSYSIPYSNGRTTSYSTHVYSYPVTSTFPGYYSLFACRDRYVSITHIVDMESIPRELVHNVTKDFKGGVLIKKVSSDTKGIPVQVNDVIISAEQERVEKVQELNRALQNTKGPNTNLKLIRNQKIIQIRAPVTYLTEEIRGNSKERIAKLCQFIPESEAENSFGATREVAMPSLCPRASKPKEQPASDL